MENLTKETFKEKVFDFDTEINWNFKGVKPAIIDFYADWCGPCKVMSPILEDLEREYPAIDFYKVDIETEDALAAILKIRSIPAILFIPLKGDPEGAVGATSKENIKFLIKSILGVSIPEIE
jgi:thioredoxin 1